MFPSGRNSSAVEHFTRNEGVPSSNLGFGSTKRGCQRQSTKRKGRSNLFEAAFFCFADIGAADSLFVDSHPAGAGDSWRGCAINSVSANLFRPASYNLLFIDANGSVTLYVEEIEDGDEIELETFTGGYIYNAPELTAEFEGEFYRATVMGNRFIAYDEDGEAYGPFIRK